MKKVNKKECKNCGVMFTPRYSSVQMVCSALCAYQYAAKEREKKQAKNKKDLEQARKEKKDKQSLQYLKTNVTAICHQYIRERDKGKPCVSCGAKWNKNFQAGHFYKASDYSNLKYHEDNIHGQCRVCNLHKDGNFAGCRIGLEKRYSKEYVETLDQLASEYKKESFKWDREYLKEIRKYYKQKIKEL